MLGITSCYSISLSLTNSIRTLGSAAVSCTMIAQGCADAYVEYGLHCWDYAAGAVIVQEAGGVVLYPTGQSMSCHSQYKKRRMVHAYGMRNESVMS